LRHEKEATKEYLKINLKISLFFSIDFPLVKDEQIVGLFIYVCNGTINVLTLLNKAG
jgi:hypothetical protein